MLDFTPAVDTSEAGGKAPLPAGAATGGDRLSASPELFTAALTAQAGEQDQAEDDLRSPVPKAAAAVAPLPDGETGDGLPEDVRELFVVNGLSGLSGPAPSGAETTAEAGAAVPAEPVPQADPDGVVIPSGKGVGHDGRADGGSQTAASAREGLPLENAKSGEAVSGSERAALVEGMPMKDRSDGAAGSTSVSAAARPAAAESADDVRNARRPGIVPPSGQVNDQRSPATVAEGGRGTGVPPATPDVAARGPVVRSGLEAQSEAADAAEWTARPPGMVDRRGTQAVRTEARFDGGLVVPREVPPSLLAAPARPADFDPMRLAMKLQGLREQIAVVADQTPEVTSVSPGVSHVHARTESEARAEAAVELAQTVKATMLGRGDEILSKLLRASAAASETAQPRVVSHGVTPTVAMDIATTDGDRSHTPLPQVPLLATMDGADEAPRPGKIGIEVRRYEEITRLLEHVRVTAAGAAEGAASSLTARAGELAQDFAATAARATAAPFASLEQYELPDQLVRAIRLQWRDGLGEARIRLNPPHLGEVQVALQVRQGAVSAFLTSDSDVVRGWIRSQQHELKAMLAGQGLELDQLVVEEDRRSRQQADEAFDQHPRRAPRRLPSDARFEVHV